MGREIVLEILKLSWMGTLLGLVLLALRPLTRRLFSWKWHYYIWAVVFLRLLLPVHPDPGAVPAPVIWNPVQFLEEGVQTGQEEAAADTAVEKAADTEDTVNMASGASDGSTDLNGSGSPDSISAGTSAGTSAQTSAAGASAGAAGFPLFHWMFLIWGFGALLMLLLKINDYRNFVRYVKADCTCVEDEGILRQAEEIRREMHIRKWAWICGSPLVASPVLIGVFRPFVVLPKEKMTPEESALILRHELTHLKRKDIWYKWLFQIVLCLHWYNPFVYWFGKTFDKDCELSCDESVVRTLTEEERRSYGNILLDTAERHMRFRGSVLSTTLLEGKKDLKRRLSGIAGYRKRGFAAVCLSVLVFGCVTALAACTDTAGRTGDDSPDVSAVETHDAAAQEEGETGGFWSRLFGTVSRNSWRDSVMNESFGVDASDDAYKVYNDDTLMAGKDVEDTVWRAYFYSGGDGSVKAEVFAFCGSDSVLILEAEKPVEISVDASWEAVNGDFKLVHVSPDGAVATVKEEGQETSTPIEMETGRNVIKMVGREARLEKLNIQFKGLNADGISAVYSSEEEEDSVHLAARIASGDATKQEYFEALPTLDEEEALEGFQRFLERKTELSDSELQEIFIYIDEKKAGDALLEAIRDDGYPHPMQGTISNLMTWLDDDTTAALVEELTKEEYSFNLLEDLLLYLNSEAGEQCLEHYYAIGNRLTYSQYSDIEYMLDENVKNKLNAWMQEE